jgi:hypothetical protein
MSGVNLPQSLYEDETFDDDETIKPWGQDDGITLRLQLQATIESAKEHEREQRSLEAEENEMSMSEGWGIIFCDDSSLHNHSRNMPLIGFCNCNRYGRRKNSRPISTTTTSCLFASILFLSPIPHRIIIASEYSYLLKVLLETN